MSRSKAALNAQEKRELADPTGHFARRHPAARQLLFALDREQFHICEVKMFEHHAWLRLGCGAIVSAYRSGRVLVQGRIHGLGSHESKEMLETLLPAGTVWQVRVID